MTEPIHQAIRTAYEAVPYVGRPFHQTHPNRLLAVARLHGVPIPKLGTISVLEIGSGDGSNLLPMAAGAPHGRFVGVDLSARLTASARAMAEELRLNNVRLLEADVRDIPAKLGWFDVVIAHGFYSWVPPDVRDAMFGAISRHLAPGGVAYVAYNLLPGGWIRRIGWDAMQFHVRDVRDPAERVTRAREFISLMVESWRTQPGPGAALAENFAHEAERDDGGIFHDDLAPLNEPVYYSTFVAHAARHRLLAFADVDPSTRGLGPAGAALRERLAARDPVAREQMLDFVHLRQMRATLLVHANVGGAGRRDPRHVAELHFAASMPYMRHRLAGGAAADPVGDTLAAHFPASIPAARIVDALASRGVRADDAPARIVDAWVTGVADPYADALALSTRPSARPRAGAVARWQASRLPLVTNQRHVSVRLADDFARALLPLCDGTRTQAELLARVRAAVPAAEAADPKAAVERRLAQFASAALLDA
ncbi:putative protein RP789 [Burkholderiales bacterium]|nr:putative protein RP789 [Burkholderiales bacterium]